MAASTTLVIAISQVNRLFSKKLVNLTEYQICNISNYGNKNKNKKNYKKKYSKPYVSRNPTESKHTSQSNPTFEDDFEKGDEAKKTTKRKVKWFTKTVMVHVLVDPTTNEAFKHITL